MCSKLGLSFDAWLGHLIINEICARRIGGTSANLSYCFKFVSKYRLWLTIKSFRVLVPRVLTCLSIW